MNQGRHQTKLYRVDRIKQYNFTQKERKMEMDAIAAGHQYLRELYPNDTPHQYLARLHNLNDNQLLWECFYLFTRNKRHLYYGADEEKCHEYVIECRYQRKKWVVLSQIQYYISQLPNQKQLWRLVEFDFHYFKEEGMQKYLNDLYFSIDQLLKGNGYQGTVPVLLKTGLGKGSKNGCKLVKEVQTWIQKYQYSIEVEQQKQKGQIWGFRIQYGNKYSNYLIV